MDFLSLASRTFETRKQCLWRRRENFFSGLKIIENFIRYLNSCGSTCSRNSSQCGISVKEIPSFEIREIMPGEHDCMSKKRKKKIHQVLIFMKPPRRKKTFSSSLFDVGEGKNFFSHWLDDTRCGWRHFIEYLCALLEKNAGTGERKKNNKKIYYHLIWIIS